MLGKKRKFKTVTIFDLPEWKCYHPVLVSRRSVSYPQHLPVDAPSSERRAGLTHSEKDPTGLIKKLFHSD